MDLEQALDEACREAAIEDELRDEVRLLVERPEAEWPICCGSDCNPCVLILQRAAKLALAKLK